LIHLAAAGAREFASGLNDHQLAERIIEDRRADEDQTTHATRIVRMAASLKQRHKTTRLGEKATMDGGRQPYWRWHLGEKVPVEPIG